MGTLLNNFSFIDDANKIGILNRRQTMRDSNTGPTNLSFVKGSLHDLYKKLIRMKVDGGS